MIKEIILCCVIFMSVSANPVKEIRVVSRNNCIGGLEGYLILDDILTGSLIDSLKLTAMVKNSKGNLIKKSVKFFVPHIPKFQIDGKTGLVLVPFIVGAKTDFTTSIGWDSLIIFEKYKTIDSSASFFISDIATGKVADCFYASRYIFDFSEFFNKSKKCKEPKAMNSILFALNCWNECFVVHNHACNEYSDFFVSEGLIFRNGNYFFNDEIVYIDGMIKTLIEY